MTGRGNCLSQCKVEVLSFWQLSTGIGGKKGWNCWEVMASSLQESCPKNCLQWQQIGAIVQCRYTENIYSFGESRPCVRCVTHNLTCGQTGRKWALAWKSKCSCFSPLCMMAAVVSHRHLNSHLVPIYLFFYESVHVTATKLMLFVCALSRVGWTFLRSWYQSNREAQSTRQRDGDCETVIYYKGCWFAVCLFFLFDIVET